MAQITYNAQDVSLPEINPNKVSSWLNKIATQEGCAIRRINYIFCSDTYLLEVNKQYLNHDYYTDIITFDLSEDDTITSDIYISIDRVKDNAQTHEVSSENELLRVLAHGLLHLIGFNDKTEDEQLTMRKKEEASLSLWQKL